MEVEIFTLCDAATEDNGKLNILGAFDQLTSGQFPFTHPLCALAMRVRVERMEEGRRQFAIQLVNADGQPFRPPVTGEFKVGFGPQNADWKHVNMALPIPQLRFERPGIYSIDLSIDGQHQRSVPFRVVPS
jgi:hypothetical protein